jgi:hypothetical protein
MRDPATSGAHGDGRRGRRQHQHDDDARQADESPGRALA